MEAQCRASRMQRLKFLRMKCTYLGGPGRLHSTFLIFILNTEIISGVFLLIIFGISKILYVISYSEGVI